MTAIVCCTGERLARKLNRLDLQWIIDRGLEKNKVVPTHPEALCLQRYCREITIDIGCGAEKVHPGVLGIDKLKFGEKGQFGCMHGVPAVADISADAMHLDFIPDETVDSVVSKHCFEHLVDSREVLREWLRILKIGGLLAMVLPHDGFQVDFLALDVDHKFRCYPEIVEVALKYMNQTGSVKGRIVENGQMVIPGWSFFSLIERC